MAFDQLKLLVFMSGNLIQAKSLLLLCFYAYLVYLEHHSKGSSCYLFVEYVKFIKMSGLQQLFAKLCSNVHFLNEKSTAIVMYLFQLYQNKLHVFPFEQTIGEQCNRQFWTLRSTHIIFKVQYCITFSIWLFYS